MTHQIGLSLRNEGFWTSISQSSIEDTEKTSRFAESRSCFSMSRRSSFVQRGVPFSYALAAR